MEGRMEGRKEGRKEGGREREKREELTEGGSKGTIKLYWLKANKARKKEFLNMCIKK